MSSEFRADVTSKIVTFLRQIGIPVSAGEVDDGSFLPGIQVVAGGLVVDESKLKYPGDLLHEAGHLAVTPAHARSHLSGQVETPDANPDVIESAAMCWSYAACVYLEIDPAVVFHEHGYHGRAQGLLLNFQLGVFPGVHELVSAEMTSASSAMNDPDRHSFPMMKKWLRS
ncbi:MAG TPA: hypothetical protein VMZ26_02280 [Pyrinomonadaceae bacterium]|nr:hypothetical protein [Pyrinomonadaceae bacterium]